MNRSLFPLLLSAILTPSVAAWIPAAALAGTASAPDHCVLFEENCGGGTTLGVACGEGDHGVPKKMSNILLGTYVFGATLTMCKTGEQVTVTDDTDLCTLDGYNDNVCNIELILASLHVECPQTPTPTCTNFGTADAKLTDSDDDAKDKLSWKLTDGPPLTNAEYGNPPFGLNSYAMCVYIDGTLGVEAKAHADSLQWKTLKDKGFSYKGRKGDPAGIKKIKLTASESASISVLRKAPLPAPGDTLQIQLIDGSGRCFQGTL